MFLKLISLILPLTLISCATGHKYMRGSVVMKLDKATAHNSTIKTDGSFEFEEGTLVEIEEP
jgi:hypothetical protein